MPAKPLNLVPLHVSLLVLSAMAVFAIAAKSAGIVLNVTGSMPDMVYAVGHGEKGSMVSFCSPISHPSIGHGSCPDGSMPLIKRVVGVAGDRVTASDAGLKSTGNQCRIQGRWIWTPREAPFPICADRLALNKGRFGLLANTRTALIHGILGL
jgi:type IV secretory pathway protease TraF